MVNKSLISFNSVSSAFLAFANNSSSSVIGHLESFGGPVALNAFKPSTKLASKYPTLPDF